jgi:hypothetical protein
MIQTYAFKEKGKERSKGRPQLGGAWKVPSLVALEMRRKNIVFSSLHFSPHKILLKHFFPIDFKVLFYHGSRPLLYIFLSFSLTYKL